MSVYASKAFWKASAERALKTFAQTAAALLGVDQVGLLDIDWGQVASVSGAAAFLSVLTSVGSAQVGNAGPSLAAEVLTPPAPPIPAEGDNA